VGMPARAKPGDVVIETLDWYGLVPRVVHSTSWRHDDGRLILTYAAVVEPPETVPADTLEVVEVPRTDLARGDATAPPSDIGVLQVVEHALRHLSWLVLDDPAIGSALPTGGGSSIVISRSRSARSADAAQTSMITGRITGFRCVTSLK
jgi:hypothetical protein